jgi:hypothetical protein
MYRIVATSLTAAAILVGTLVAPAPSFAWCAAMGGYASFEEQARAEARKRRETDRTQLRSDQQSLARLGYYRGPVDGQAGPATTTAISKFRSANKLGGAGSLDDTSRQALNDCVAALDNSTESGKKSGAPDSCCSAGATGCPTGTAKK